jgi:hypothetical protein
MSLLSLCWHNKALLPANCLKSPISQLANSCNISWMLIWDCSDGELSPPLSSECIPWTTRRSHQVPMDSLIWRKIHPAGESGWGPRMHNRTQWGTGTSKGRGAPLIRLVRTQVQIQACPRRQKGNLITSQWDILVTTIFGVKPCLSGSGSGMEVQCCMRVYENASWDAAQLQSKWGVPSHSVSVW